MSIRCSTSMQCKAGKLQQQFNGIIENSTHSCALPCFQTTKLLHDAVGRSHSDLLTDRLRVAPMRMMLARGRTGILSDTREALLLPRPMMRPMSMFCFSWKSFSLLSTSCIVWVISMRCMSEAVAGRALLLVAQCTQGRKHRALLSDSSTLIAYKTQS